ncbi:MULTISPECIES: phage tail assembly protein [Streptomyces]|uniref:phage tail assembly protein n=1 Tax=Streptomyces TaxID=1883 RepID=UPI00226FAD0C|nr:MULTISPECIES: phage tail assembly protein [unclassified Streptomyces]MCY0921663.1 phage tail assembly protein [Streptomyces sp. H27-G5]MCY0943996.1 phage tail assembly protein [Streptomyces sp. H34-AA3]MCY0956284.1 phage tail assembly protein [Streptomyces sp. H27-H5]MCZ4082304.1 phage tail assembly protein [Streptomyces sp. H34-S5]
MASYSLDAIRDAAEARYGSTDIELNDDTIRLLNPLRLSKAARSELTQLQDRMGGEDADQEELLSEAIRLVAEHPKAATKLLTAINGDLAVLAEIFDAYGRGTQAGEA